LFFFRTFCFGALGLLVVGFDCYSARLFVLFGCLSSHSSLLFLFVEFTVFVMCFSNLARLYFSFGFAVLLVSCSFCFFSVFSHVFKIIWWCFFFLCLGHGLFFFYRFRVRESDGC